MAKAAAIVLICLYMAACTPSAGGLCTAGPILLDEADSLSRGTLEQIIALNRAGERICGWRGG